MAGLSYKARTTLTIWRRGLWRYRLTTVGVLLALWGATTSLADLPKPVSGTVGLLGLLIAVLEIRANRRRSATIEFQERVADDYRDVVDQLTDRVVRTATDVGVVLTRQTDLLLTDSPHAEQTAAAFELHPDMKRHSFDFLARRARKSAMHNDLVLGLATDLPAHPTADPVVFRPALYFNFICSNILAQHDVFDAGHRIPVLAGRRLFLDRRGRLRTLADSRLANTVGVSTLAFTTDGKLVLVMQTKETAGSPQLIAPSGSGALEPRDLPTGDHTPPTVRDVVHHGAERELWEECNLEPDHILASCLTGHARWISRGAMPEFSAVTLLNLTSDA